MKHLLLILATLSILSCAKKKQIQLPEITFSEISEINDVSAAYIFFSNSKKNSAELNRKNLISTTNWLINIDKRLRMNDVIPEIEFLQNKKQNSSHKNKAARNYFTCHNTASNNLGFIDFTDITYSKISNINETHSIQINEIHLNVFSLNKILIKNTNKLDLESKINTLQNALSNISLDNSNITTVVLYLSSNLSFQEYITLKSTLNQLEIKNIAISNIEYIFN